MSSFKWYFIVLFIFFNKILICQVQDWKPQTCRFVSLGTTSNDEVDYNWELLSNVQQGVLVNVDPSEILCLYIEQGNSKIQFSDYRSPNGGSFAYFTRIRVSVNNSILETIYEGSAIGEFILDCSLYFENVGTYNLNVEFLEFGSIYTREYSICVVPKSDALLRDNYGNTMRVWKSNSERAKPVVLSPGFDAYNIKPEQYYRHAGNDLFNCLLSNGFDIYVAYYKLNSQDIRNNAAVYSSAVRYVSDNFYYGQDIVSAGISMGGLITRYALAKAEHYNNVLPVDTWISLDAPHQGAYISSSLQNFMIGKLAPNSFDSHALENDAAKIMLEYNAYDPEANLRTDFYGQLYNLNGNWGFPRIPNSIGVSFSNAIPNEQEGLWLNIDWMDALDLFGWGEFEMEDREKIAGSYLPSVNVDPSTVRIAWGLYWANKAIYQFKNPTFMSHKTSLDLDDDGNTKFDVVIIPSVTGFHHEIPLEIIPDIVDGIIPQNKIIQNKNIAGNIIFNAKNDIIVGSNITNEIPPGEVLIASNSNVLFEAGNSVSFEPGFTVEYGAEFEVLINTPYYYCSGDYTLLNENNDNTNNEELESSIKNKFQDTYIYPNPFSDEFTIVFDEKLKGETILSITDNTGRLIAQQQYSINDNTIVYNAEELQTGIYYLSIISKNREVENLKIIKK